jgi:hypothetical protein
MMQTEQERLPVGSLVKIPRQPGEYKIKGYNKDGSYLLYGGMSGHGMFRDSHSVKLIVAKKRRTKVEA